MRRCGRPGRVVIVTGRSGGHIFPAVSAMERICSEIGAKEVMFVLPDRAMLPSEGKFCSGRRSVTLPYPPPELRKALGRFATLLYLPLITFKSLFILLCFRPAAVAGFGSICSVPMVFFAHLFGIRTLIHEQNVIPGKATLFLSRFADKVAVSFGGTKEYLGAASGRAVLTGNPLRGGLRKVDKKEARDFFGLSAEKFTVLVTGGSQGSSRINDSFVGAVKLLKEPGELQVVHLTGSGDFARVKESYRGCGAEARVFEFLSSMEYAYSAADLIISRAGAITVSEIVYYGLPAIIIPYPFAGRHQDANAGVLQQSGAAIVIDDRLVSAELLRAELERAVVSGPRTAAYTAVAGNEACRLVAEEIIDLTCH
ncbi:MAG: UDP-N-acetylglucosamine--N-acetylmuramyl-(pentapeptide) pyrophosphoryl-undecaprenol N-acetylglucosamine transferase [Candidatus Omnitrophota bacterium]